MLRDLKSQFPPEQFPQLVVGLDAPDDAAVYLLDDDHALVQTLDFFAPVVDDPYEYGAIAAANAMSDVYAMGGSVLFALNIAAFPEDLPTEIAAEILRGGAEKVREAGAAIAGGHTIIDEEPKYGLAVTGVAHPDKVRRNAGALPGDAIILTKPIGTGVLIGANGAGAVAEPQMRAAIEQMMTLNKTAAEVAADYPVRAMADVTGFGLAGHFWELAEQSRAAIELDLDRVEALDGLAEAVAAGFGSGGQNRNRDFFGPKLDIERELTPLEDALLYDPQTSGGLLISAGLIEAPHLEQALRAAGVPAAIIANVAAQTPAGALRVV